MAYNGNRALELLRIGTDDPGATFRVGQEEAIQHVVENRGRLLLVQRAGWGKSFVYFIASKLLREQDGGPALLVSPLLALMRNQIEAARRMGVKAGRIDSSNTDDWHRINKEIIDDQIDILLVSPERLGNQIFVEEVLASAAERISTLIVDEAHCISDWGHDFRPDYQRIDRILSSLPQNLRLLATTATVNGRVMEDLERILGAGLAVMHGSLGLPSVKLQTIRMPDRAERMAWLADTIPKLEGSGIVYALTVRDTERVAEWLSHRGIAARAYHGQMQDERPILEQQLLDNKVKCLVATTALGMGFDKPDLGFVIHFQTPGSVVAYYQQVGRAGRAIDSAYGVLLSGDEEYEINEHFITSAFPTSEEAGEILRALETSPEGLTIREIEGKANVSHGRIEKSTKILALESPAPIVKDGSKWRRTAAGIGSTFWGRVVRLTERRRGEVEQMKAYVDLGSGHMQFLIEAMDGDPDRTIAAVDLPLLPTQVRRQTVLYALTFLRGKPIEISPRKRWPPGGYRDKSSIDADHQAEEGRALCVYGDSGWGHLVREGKYSKNHFEDELVDGVVEMFEEWDPQPRPDWVTCVPSARDNALVADFAERVAQRLGLPFSQALTKKSNFPEQKDMNNSAHKVRNVARSIELVGLVDPGPVLLIDDIVDSGWTFTVAAWRLLNTGSGPVWPLATMPKIGELAKGYLLLTGRLAVGRRSRSDTSTPLKLRELNGLEKRLADLGHSVLELTASGSDELLNELGERWDVSRMRGLLRRGMKMSLAIEKWQRRAIWVLCRDDEEYPKLFKDRMGVSAPPIIYGCGISIFSTPRALQSSVLGARIAGRWNSLELLDTKQPISDSLWFQVARRVSIKLR